MNEFVRCNKVTGLHWLKGPVDNVKIMVKLKPPDDIISLPKFEDFINDSIINLEQKVEEFTFNWQEKYFSASDIHRYKDVYNCLTENELKYHELIKSKEIVPSKVFSYIHDDYYMPLPQERKRNVKSISSCLECLNLEDAVGRIGDALGGKTLSERHLFKSQEDVGEEEDAWSAMHIVLDKSDYNEEILLLKQEAVLVSLYHNVTQNYLIISPNMNKLETNPYAAETNTGEPLGYQYEVNLEFGDMDGGEELGILLTKLYKKWEKKHKILVNFIMPPLGKTQYWVAFELISAREFDVADMYVEYHIKLPEGIQCKDALTGRSQVSEPAFVEDSSVWHFGHLIDLCLEADGVDPPPLQIYLEAISTDFWHRHRTEGYCWFHLPLTPGTEEEEARCVRPEDGEERRFFLGGCHLIKDLEVLAKPELQNGDYTYTETGTIKVRHTIVSQSPLHQRLPTSGGLHETSTASALLLGAEAALRKYRKARDRLAQATTWEE